MEGREALNKNIFIRQNERQVHQYFSPLVHALSMIYLLHVKVLFSLKSVIVHFLVKQVETLTGTHFYYKVNFVCLKSGYCHQLLLGVHKFKLTQLPTISLGRGHSQDT